MWCTHMAHREPEPTSFTAPTMRAKATTSACTGTRGSMHVELLSFVHASAAVLVI